MKRVILFLVIVVLGWNSKAFSQATKEQIKQDATIFLESSKNKDYEALMEYTNLSQFKKISKEDVIEKYKQNSTRTDMKTEMLGLQVLQISEVVDYQGARYAIVDYSLELKTTYQKPIPRKGLVKFAQSMNRQHGYDNWRQKGNVVTVNGERRLVANLETDAEHWTFIDYNPKVQKQSKMLTPIGARKLLKLEI